MNRNAIRSFSDQLRSARERALADSEAFDGIVYVVERLGSFLAGRILDLGKYRDRVQEQARASSLVEDIPRRWPQIHIPFSRLYEHVRSARNDALHQGAYARRLTEHAIQLSIVLEDALRQNLDQPSVGDYMVSNPICAADWQPISFVR